MEMLIIACVLFVGGHLLLSHPFRAPLVRAIGDGRFLQLYSLLMLVSFGWMIYAFRRIPPEAPLWVAGDGLWALSSLIMLVAAIFLMGSFVRNPALPMTSESLMTQIPVGIFRITRHAMNWSFILWAIAHCLVSPRPAVLVLAGSIAALAVVGSIGQDMKKRKLIGAPWVQWMEQTSFIPFAKGAVFPGMHAVGGGLLIWLFVTWAHPLLGSGMPAGIWRWVG